MRTLTFSDNNDNEQEWIADGGQSVFDAFWEFVRQHRTDENLSFSVEDEENGEALLLMLGVQVICRAKSEPGPRSEYRLVTNDSDYRNQVVNFARGGFAALNLLGPWWPDVPSLLRAQLRSDVDGSALRRTHPRELRRRLEVLTAIDGREPVTSDGVTRFGFGNGGDTVNAWFAADGRGLLVIFDHASALNVSEDGSAQAALYDGVPADLFALARNVPESDTALTVPHPDGGTLVAATGVFHFSGPCAMAAGLVSRLQEERLGVDDTGVGSLLEGFLALDDFTPESVAETAAWWSAEDIASGFAAAAARGRELPEIAPLDREAAERFCRIWGDSGYNDRWDVHYVFFDGSTVEDAGEARDELLRLIQSLGFERVEAPPGAADGEVWVRSDPRIDAELERWS